MRESVRAGRARRAAHAARVEVVSAARLLMALKAAAAAAIAWYLAPLIPFADAEYSYYAPLGVLVSMYPTVADSARAGAQSLIGLGCGIVLGLGGLALVVAGSPGIVAVAVVVGAGTALGGIRALGPGRDWIAMAGLFVLLLGGPDAEGFSVSYIITMAFGVLVGVTINLIVFPPLFLQWGAGRLATLRDAVAQQLAEMAEMTGTDRIDKERLDEAGRDLAGTVVTVSADVREAGRSTVGNPRARRRTAQDDDNARGLRCLERAAFLTRELALVLAEQAAGDSPRAPRTELARALSACAAVVGSPTDAPETGRLRREADAAVASYRDAVHARASGTVRELAAAALIGRILDTTRVDV